MLLCVIVGCTRVIKYSLFALLRMITVTGCEPVYKEDTI
jgi:hypothetical protein